MSSIKITSFKRIIKPKQPQQPRPFTINKDPVLLNVLLYSESQNLSINSFEKWLRTENNLKINFMKLVDRKSIIPTIKALLQKKYRKTYFVTTKYLTYELQALIQANQNKQIADLLQQLKFILFADKIQHISPNNFWIKDVCLISSKIQDIQSYLSDQLLSLQHSQSDEVSSLNSENQAAFEQQFVKKWSPISLPKSSPNKQGEIVFNDVPEVGTYSITVDQKFKGSLSGTFSKQAKLKQKTNDQPRTNE